MVWDIVGWKRTFWDGLRQDETVSDGKGHFETFKDRTVWDKKGHFETV